MYGEMKCILCLTGFVQIIEEDTKMSTWENFGEMANVAQLAGLDAVKIIGLIVKADAQEELQAVCAAPQVDRELAGATQDLGDEEVPGDTGAIGAARGCAEEVLHFGQQLPGPELSLFACDGVEHCVSVSEGAE